MGSRSNISVVGNTTNAVNCGVGTGCIFIGKQNDNILNFRSIATAGSLSIITGATTITISGSTGGGSGTITGGTNGLCLADAYTLKLGGELCEDTNIDLFGQALTIEGTNTGIRIEDMNNICVCAELNSLVITSTGTTYFSNDGNAIQYGADYSANYINRSIPDVAYVTGYTQSQISGLIGGINGSIQYNDNGVFSGSSAFVFDDSLNTFSFYGTPVSTSLITMRNPYGYGQNFKYLRFTCCEGTEIGGICYCSGDIHFHGRSIVPHSSEIGLSVGCQGKDTTICGCQVNVLGQKWFTLAQSGLSSDKTIFVSEFTVPAGGCCELFIVNYDSGTTIQLNSGINYFCVIGLATEDDGTCTCCAACKIEGIMDGDGAILGTPTYTTLFDNTCGEYQFLVSGITGNFHVYGCSTIPTYDSVMSAKINIYGIE